jgi:hypothetical protein
MQRMLSLLVGPLVGFGVSAFVAIVGLQFLSRDVVAPMAAGLGLAAVTYFTPIRRRGRSLPFSLALGLVVALFFAITIRLYGNAPA